MAHDKLDKIHHIAIQVEDITKAVAWYQANLHCKLIHQDESWALLQFANISLALVLPRQHPSHFAVTTEHPEQFGQTITHRDGTTSVYINDPFNNTIEMIKGAEHVE